MRIKRRYINLWETCNEEQESNDVYSQIKNESFDRWKYENVYSLRSMLISDEIKMKRTQLFKGH